jgi:hypothetical protein
LTRSSRYHKFLSNLRFSRMTTSRTENSSLASAMHMLFSRILGFGDFLYRAVFGQEAEAFSREKT